MSGKSIRRSEVEDAFEALLRSLRPSEDLFELASSIFNDLWKQRSDASMARRSSMKAEVSQIDRKIAQLMDRLVEADSTSVIRAYERKIGDLEDHKLLLEENIENLGTPLDTYEETFRTAMGFLSNPYKIWENGSIEHRKAVMKLAFSDQLAYRKGKGFRTPEISMPFGALREFSASGEKMVRPTGFEPVAPRLGI